MVSDSLAAFFIAAEYLNVVFGRDGERIEPSKLNPTKKKTVKAIRQEIVNICGNPPPIKKRLH